VSAQDPYPWPLGEGHLWGQFRLWNERDWCVSAVPLEVGLYLMLRAYPERVLDYVREFKVNCQLHGTTLRCTPAFVGSRHRARRPSPMLWGATFWCGIGLSVSSSARNAVSDERGRQAGFRRSRNPMEPEGFPWSWGESNPRPPWEKRSRYDHSRGCDLRSSLCRVNGSPSGSHRRIFLRCQRSFSPSAVFPCGPPLLLLPGCSDQAPGAIAGPDDSHVT
jgi:hypothetical protein